MNSTTPTAEADVDCRIPDLGDVDWATLVDPDGPLGQTLLNHSDGDLSAFANSI